MAVLEVTEEMALPRPTAAPPGRLGVRVVLAELP